MDPLTVALAVAAFGAAWVAAAPKASAAPQVVSQQEGAPTLKRGAPLVWSPPRVATVTRFVVIGSTIEVVGTNLLAVAPILRLWSLVGGAALTAEKPTDARMVFRVPSSVRPDAYEVALGSSPPREVRLGVVTVSGAVATDSLLGAPSAARPARAIIGKLGVP